jgi:O-antigen/teichoic acid export membrane protein
MTYPGIMYAFFEVRSAEATVKYLGEFHIRGERDRVLAVCMLGYMVDCAFATVSFLAVLATSSWAAKHLVQRPDAAGLIILYASALIPRALVGTSQATLATLGKFRLLAGIEVVSTIVRVTLISALVILGWKVTGIVLGNAIAATFMGLLYGTIASVVIRRTWGLVSLRSAWPTLHGHFRAILGFYLYSDFNVLLSMLMKNIDIVLVGYFRHPTEVGYYKLAKSLAGAIGTLASPLQTVIYPKLLRLWVVGRVEDFQHMVYKLAVGSLLPLGSIVLLSVLLVPWLVFYLLGDAYIPASLAIQLLLITTGLRLIGFWVKPFYLSTGQLSLWTLFSLIGAVVSVPVYASCTWLWGFQGLAAARIGITLVTDIMPGLKAVCWKKQYASIAAHDDHAMP